MEATDHTLERAVQDADLRVLLMCVFHLTGDRSWLEAPYLPTRDTSLISPEDAGFSVEIADAIRVAAIHAAEAVEAGSTPAVQDPGDELMIEMMTVCLGQSVPPEYAPMMREEMGFLSRDVEWPTEATGDPTPAPKILVVGAGASGIIMGGRLERLGLAYTIVERGSSLGGVWRDNRYPGAGVDTPNHAYSFSFAPPNRWSRYFAPQPELEDYLQRSADHCGVTPHIEFDTELTGAEWDDEAQAWNVTLRSGAGIEHRSCGVLISAIGQLNAPKYSDITGTADFGGELFHSSHWPDDLEIDGQRVAVIGTGASSMQIVPAIAGAVGSLTIFQRSAQWARPIPRYQDPIPAGSQWLFEHLPFYAAWFRFSMLWRYGDGLLPFLRKDPEWPFPERSVNRINDRHRQEMAEHIESELAGRPDLVAKCMPTYPPYGKRILLDGGWFRTLLQPGVHLVDDAVDHIDATGVVDATGAHHEVDIIVMATGFEVFQMASRLGIVGRNGTDLADEWADDDPTAYLGVTVPKFPNFYCMQGPTTGLGHGGSAIFQAECHARHITGCLAEVARRGASSLEVRAEPVEEYTAALDAEHEELIWTHPGMRNWYRNDAGRVVAIMPWRLVDYWRMTHDVDPTKYIFR